MNEVAWNAIEEDKKNRIPTPPIRTTVQWYQGGDKNICLPGIVTGIEGPGRLKIVLFPINSFPRHQAGVYHEDHKVHSQKGNPTTSRCGSWGFEDGFRIPKEWYDLHDQEIAKRELNLRTAEQAAITSAELFMQKNAEKANAAKKRLPDPLPAPTF